MSDSTYSKTPVHEVVAVLPTGKAAGYRCILTTDPSKIYTYGADGTWSTDSDLGYGLAVSVVGLLGGTNQVATYLNANVYSDKVTPHFGAGFTNNIVSACYWGDILAVLRMNAAKNVSDALFIEASGDSYLTALTTSGGSDEVIKAVTDSRGNLWVATKSSGLLKFEDGQKSGYPTAYVTTNFNIPFDTITDIIADGITLWIIYASGTDLKLAYYDGYSWTDMTAQFETDLTACSIDADACTAIKYFDMAADEDYVMFTMVDASFTGNLFYYDKAAKTFYVKTLPSAFTGGNVCKKIIKSGDNVYTLVNNDSSTKVGKLWVWSWDDLTALYTEATVTCTDFVTDGTKIMLWNATTIQSIALPGYTPVTETAMIAAVTAELTDSAVLALIDIAMKSDGKICFLNLDTAKKNIIEAVPTLGWTVTNR